MNDQKQMSKVGLAVIGDVLDINCWSNTPYYFYHAGQALDLINEPWSLPLREFTNARRLWNLKQILTGKGKGGYQYSNSFLELAESKIPSSYYSSKVISFSQVFPRASSVVKAGGEMYYYIDSTLTDLFRYGFDLPLSIKEKALRLEKENYEKAKAVITMGHWVHNSLVHDYGIDRNKIFQVLPGANINLPLDFTFSPLHEGAGISKDLVLGFVGKDWKRKGLPFLLQVRDELTKRGYRVKIKVVGHCPEELKHREGIVYTGFINKQSESQKFIEVISSCDIGCLFSEAEPLGISTLEFLRVGIPVSGFLHQGLKDTLLQGASLPFEMNSTVEQVADNMERLILHPDLLKSLRQKAQQYSPHLTWSATAIKIKSIL